MGSPPNLVEIKSFVLNRYEDFSCTILLLTAVHVKTILPWFLRSKECSKRRTSVRQSLGVQKK